MGWRRPLQNSGETPVTRRRTGRFRLRYSGERPVRPVPLPSLRPLDGSRGTAAKRCAGEPKLNSYLSVEPVDQSGRRPGPNRFGRVDAERALRAGRHAFGDALPGPPPIHIFGNAHHRTDEAAGESAGIASDHRYAEEIGLTRRPARFPNVSTENRLHSQAFAPRCPRRPRAAPKRGR